MLNVDSTAVPFCCWFGKYPQEYWTGFSTVMLIYLFVLHCEVPWKLKGQLGYRIKGKWRIRRNVQ